MEQLWPLVVALIAGIIVFVFGRTRAKKKGKETNTPPENRAVTALRETIQQTFEEDIGGIWKAVEGEDPAGDLADKGNARSRS